MTADKPTPLVPQRRFLEFEDAGDWEEKRLSSLVKLVSGAHLTQDMYSTTGEVPYFTGPSDFTDVIQCVAKWTDESANTAKQHDTLITVKGSGVGQIWYLTLPSVAMGRQLMAVRTEVGDRRFIYQSLSTRRAQFEALASGNLIPGLSRRDILNLAAYFPSRDEQQKVAACLGSLDNLIAAEGRKLEALRRHKQGLMQQLFPQPGETVPRLRFLEFEDAGDWEKKRLSSLVKLVSGAHLAPDMYSTTGEVPYFTGPSDFTDVIQCVAKWTDESANTAKQHDTLITVKGSGVGQIWYLTLPSVAMGRQLMAVRTEFGDRRFIHQFLSTRRAQFEALASGNLIPGLSRGDILYMAAYFPTPDEQQRIADCLTAHDDLIAAQTQKLNALKTHKQGLLQQLFPMLEGNK